MRVRVLLLTLVCSLLSATPVEAAPAWTHGCGLFELNVEDECKSNETCQLYLYRHSKSEFAIKPETHLFYFKQLHGKTASVRLRITHDSPPRSEVAGHPRLSLPDDSTSAIQLLESKPCVK